MQLNGLHSFCCDVVGVSQVVVPATALSSGGQTVWLGQAEKRVGKEKGWAKKLRMFFVKHIFVPTTSLPLREHARHEI